MFPIFGQVHDEILALVFRNFVPSVGEQAAWWFRAFANSAAQTTAIGVIGIAATGILLLVTVEDQLNVIWRVTAPRPWGQRVLAYWTLITLGPLLVGLSFSLSTYFEIAARRAGFGQQAVQWVESGWLHGLARAVPAVLEFVALTLLYWLIPNRAVRWRDGALGALVATAAIEILKVGFTIYVGAMSYYQTVYGALSAIPIFLLWMYISWMAVLLGAEVAAALPHWRIDRRIGPVSSGGVQLGLSLGLIAALERAQRVGEQLTTAALAAELRVPTTVVDEYMRPLLAAGFAAHTQEGSWVLAWSPETATVHDLYEALRLPFAGSLARPRHRALAEAGRTGDGAHRQSRSGSNADDDRLADRRNPRPRAAPARSPPRRWCDRGEDCIGVARSTDAHDGRDRRSSNPWRRSSAGMPKRWRTSSSPRR